MLMDADAKRDDFFYQCDDSAVDLMSLFDTDVGYPSVPSVIWLLISESPPNPHGSEHPMRW